MPTAILHALAPAFFVLALGYVAGRLHAVDNHHVGEINALVMDFALPASLLLATASTPRREMIAQGSVGAILGAAMMAVYLVWYLLQRRVSSLSRAEAGVQALTVAQPNFAAVGLPIITAILGPTETVQVAVALAVGSILPSPLTLLLLELSGAEAPTSLAASALRVRGALRRALTKPIVLAPALGIALSLCGVGVSSLVGESLRLLGQSAGGVALFLTGLVLSAQPFRLDWKVAAATGTANVVRPLLVVGIVHAVHVPVEIGKASILLAALPSGFFGILFGVRYRLDSSQVGSMVIASTAVSGVTLAIAIALLYPG
jgi:malonate transporter